MSREKPRLALDAYVLAQDVKTGIYRVCDELFPRLARSERFDTQFVARPGQEARVGAYLASKGLASKLYRASGVPSQEADILLCPFGVAPKAWRNDENVLKAHFIHDLIAIRHPEYFSREASSEVLDIVASLTEHTAILTISESTKNDLLAYRPDLSPGQITVVPLAAGEMFRPCDDPLARSAMREKYGIPARSPYLLSLATLEIRKNLHQVVNAFVRFMDQHPSSDMHLVLAGMAGWKLEQLDDALVEAARWRHRIVATGYVDDDDLSALYSDAQCFICLSRYEGFGLPPLEAMACGTPVICSDNSSLPEVVGDAGLMLDADDVQGVVDCIERLSTSASLREDLAQRGLARAGLFGWDRCAQQVADVLFSSLDRYSRLIPPVRRRSTPAAIARLAATLAPARGQAGLAGFASGWEGPAFAAHRRMSEAGVHDARWPEWSDRLPAHGDAPTVEGGLRMQGRCKSGTFEAPLVTYVTIVRNNAATLARTIDSVQRQSWPHVEHVVLDGASTDGTLDVIRAHGDRLDYFASRADAGLYDALNKVVPLARGQLICVLNSDDWLEPCAAEIAVRRMRSRLDEAALLLSAAVVPCDEEVFEWPPRFVTPGSWFSCANDCHNAVYATRRAYERSGRYDAKLKIAADFKWLMTCLETGVKFVYTHEPTINYSLGGTSSNVRQHSIECMQLVAQRFPGLDAREVSGLYHAFFTLAGDVAAEQPDRPDDVTGFLRQLVGDHHAEADLLSAVSWAAMTTMEHPADARQTDERSRSIKRSLMALAKTVLVRYPRVYDAAADGYRRLKG